MSLVSLSFDVALSALDLREDTPVVGRWPKLSHYAPLALCHGLTKKDTNKEKGQASMPVLFFLGLHLGGLS